MEELKRGWIVSLGKSTLSGSVRELIEANLAKAEARRTEIDR
jgi:hypothetical protein